MEQYQEEFSEAAVDDSDEQIARWAKANASTERWLELAVGKHMRHVMARVDTMERRAILCEGKS